MNNPVTTPDLDTEIKTETKKELNDCPTMMRLTRTLSDAINNRRRQLDVSASEVVRQALTFYFQHNPQS